MREQRTKASMQTAAAVFLCLGACSSTPSVEGGYVDNVGAKRLAVLMADFEDASNPETPEEARSSVFTGPESVNQYYGEASYGRFSLVGHLREDGDVFGPVVLPFESYPCEWDDWAPVAREMVAAEGFAAENYDYVFYIFGGECTGYGRNHWSPPAMVLGGLSRVGLLHEGGHAFGWNHANSYLCVQDEQRVTLSATGCRVVEYGDVFSLMGGSAGAAVLDPVNNFLRGQFGWLRPSNTRTMLRDGQATLARVEETTDQVQVVRIPRIRAGGEFEQYVYLESRESVENGILLRLSTRYDMRTRPLLLDMHPETETLMDAALMVGERFEDPVTGIAVTLTDVDDAGTATVQVDVGVPLECTHNQPTGAFMAEPNSGRAGETTTLQVMVRNNDVDCGPALFLGTVELPAGWPQPQKPEDKPLPPAGLWLEATLSPGESASPRFPVTPPEGTAPGIYSVSTTVSGDFGEQAIINGTFTVIP